MESALRKAIERHEFQLFYQPQMDLLTGAIVGVEALIRWRHVERGLVSPAQFISTAEESGLIVPMGQWVLQEACRQAQGWLQAGFPPMRIAVNVSAVELCANNFVNEVQAILVQTGLAPSLLELELTESFLGKPSKRSATVLSELKQMGIKLALNDLSSSLSYLNCLPIDTVKINRSFVQHLGIDSADANVLGGIIGMGKQLQMQIVAEGVETRQQLEFLQQHGCPFGQGFYFGRPGSSEDFMQTLMRARRHRALLALNSYRPADEGVMQRSPGAKPRRVPSPPLTQVHYTKRRPRKASGG